MEPKERKAWRREFQVKIILKFNFEKGKFNICSTVLSSYILFTDLNKQFTAMIYESISRSLFQDHVLVFSFILCVGILRQVDSPKAIFLCYLQTQANQSVLNVT